MGKNKVIIININEGREGAEIDDKNLKTIFKYLNYEIEFWSDCSLSEFNEKIDKFERSFNFDYKSIIFFILAHGENEKFYFMNDEIGMTLYDFLEKIKFSKLRHIPKLIFFEPCRPKRLCYKFFFFFYKLFCIIHFSKKNS